MSWRKTIRALLVLLMLALVPVGIYLYQLWTASGRLESLLAELDRSEPGWRLWEMEGRKPALPEGKNSALIIKKARLPSSRKQDFMVDDLKLQPYQTLTPLQAARLREYLDQYEPNLLEARRLVDYPTGRFSITIAPDFISTLIPHVQETREIGHLLHMDMVWHAQQGGFEQVAADLEASRNAGRSIRDEPFLISQLVRLAMLNEAATILERALAQGQPAPKLLQRMQELLAEEPVFESWYAATAGERAGMHEMFRQLDGRKASMRMLRGLSGARSRWHDDITDYFAPWTAEESHAWVLQNFTEQMATRALPPRERRARLNALLAEADHAPLLAKVLMSQSWRKLYDGFLRVEAKRDATCAGLAAERFRQEKGRWPKTLDELVPGWLAKVPLDPYDGKELRYRHARDGVVIYSVGPDEKLKGDSRDAPGPPPALDVGPSHEFRLWNVDQRRRPGQDE
jgi:hypothetical protein